jgi:myo-inositol-1(or 4)-monophosphatase
MNQAEVNIDHDALIAGTSSALRDAGRIILAASVERSQIEKKSDSNYVTEIDYRVQEFLAVRLEDILPGSKLIAEESQTNEYVVELPTWILDPVDGTTNLIFDFKFSAISLALYLDGRPTLGFIYNPYLDEMFIGQVDVGAWLNSQPISVSQTTDMKQALFGFGTNPYDRSASAQTFAMISDVFAASIEIRRSGSAALDLAYVACGRLDGFFEQTLQPWDYAAGTIIVEAAGGIVRDWQGQKMPDLLRPRGIIAASEALFADLDEILGRHR